MALKDENVLVVDDDDNQLEITDNLLRYMGITRILTAHNGLEALERIKANPGITTILLDVMMPEMDGSKFLHQVAPLNVSAKIILVSSIEVNALKSIANTGRALGVDVIGFMGKPISEHVLRMQLDRQYRQQAQQEEQKQQVQPKMDIKVLVDALSKGEIEPWYQPKVDIKDYHLIGVEALARWKKSDGSLVSPGVFIPEIEASGLSDMMFFSMAERTLQDLKKWKASGKTLKASVNLSMDCAFNEGLPRKIKELLDTYGVNPSEFIVEVTESRIVSDNSVALENLQKIADMGVVLSIDDFGTGYSSLSQIAALPFGELKIDGSFVQQAGTNQKADAILQSTVTLGKSLGLSLVAEGIETHEQLDQLSAMGAEIVQGFLMARPMEASSFEQWLADWRPGTRQQPGCERNMCILVVDDDRAILEYLKALFEDQVKDARILTAKSGEQAIELLKTEYIDAATLDFHMPGINGIELLRILRNLQPIARYVLLTADTKEHIAEQATALGALYCPKPVTNAQFDRIVRFFRDD